MLARATLAYSLSPPPPAPSNHLPVLLALMDRSCSDTSGSVIYIQAIHLMGARVLPPRVVLFSRSFLNFLSPHLPSRLLRPQRLQVDDRPRELLGHSRPGRPLGPVHRPAQGRPVVGPASGGSRAPPQDVLGASYIRSSSERHARATSRLVLSVRFTVPSRLWH